MYKLLIVDDEPRIVNGLYEQFLDWGDVELEVYRAYSAVEALRIVSAAKMDIVLSDIHMPGMSGLQLQPKIMELWPRCKMIFLTGYGDFDYIQSAMRHGGVDYILKIEGDEPIFAAVRKAIARLQDELEVDRIIQGAKLQVRESLPLQRKELLMGLLEGEFEPRGTTLTRMRELEIPLDFKEEVLLVAGRIDAWRQDVVSSYDKSLFVYGVQNIADEYLTPLTKASCSLRGSEFVWFIQPAASELHEVEERWRNCEMFVRDTLSDIQASCAKLLDVQLSFAVSAASCEWEDLSIQHLKLQQMFRQGLGEGKEVLLFEPKTVMSEAGETSRTIDIAAQADGALLSQKMKKLEWHLESGQKEEFIPLFGDITRTLEALAATCGEGMPLIIEFRYALSGMFLTYLNRRGLFAEVSRRMRTEPLLNISLLPVWREAEAYLAELSELLFSLKQSEQKDRVSQIVAAVNLYIEQHISEPLSLDILADHVYLHPTYLSRLYKISAGIRVTDRIKELRMKRAKELLANTRLKVHEVAVDAGFESAHYFAKVFKREMNLTPQEYRTMVTE
ncbi:response regulator [Paenibacillus qinlingensis]|uniref:Two-component system response regulator YesN n=1 Tax=Paenibacillus qinlingensis TaxID=1837343 RepID=A0ABU1NY86_9BACL|nr:response regulator [Paenibacillus qinlingensis]MDR6552021.1 two-component system response regulator YesN [Paenibacillus qinlingensis]